MLSDLREVGDWAWTRLMAVVFRGGFHQASPGLLISWTSSARVLIRSLIVLLMADDSQKLEAMLVDKW